MNRIKEKFARFMYGRYGMDDLGKALLYVTLGLIVISIFVHNSLLNILTWVLLFYSYYRMFSKNHAKRYAENQKYLMFVHRVKAKFYAVRKEAADKEHRVFRCPSCGQKVRVPRGKGKISIHCPKCQNNFIKRS